MCASLGAVLEFNNVRSRADGVAIDGNNDVANLDPRVGTSRAWGDFEGRNALSSDAPEDAVFDLMEACAGYHVGQTQRQEKKGDK
jgi:hypothetical protein